MKSLFLISAILFLFAFSAFAQTVATTEDGTKVLLNKDKTWEYLTKQAKGNDTLIIEAGLIFRSGDVKPVARTEFYLLDKDFVQILRDKNLANGDDSKIYIDVGFALSPRYASLEKIQQQKIGILNAIKPHIVKSFTTDFEGKASVSGLEEKTYYLFGVAGTPKGFALWSMPINLAESKNITLDQNNMKSGL